MPKRLFVIAPLVICSRPSLFAFALVR